LHSVDSSIGLPTHTGSLSQSELDRYLHHHVDRNPESNGRCEAPLANSAGRLFVETSTKATKNLHVSHRPVAQYDDLEQDVSSNAKPSRLLRVVRSFFVK